MYYPISDYNKEKFGGRIQKISIDAGFTCPNRDGKLSKTGCLYCNNESFSPFYANRNCSIINQIEKGIEFSKKRYNCNRFLAYFQSFSNTYDTVQNLNKKYREALSNSAIEGLIIGTRPDCINKEIINFLKELSKDTYIRIELGIESFDDEVLHAINRGHSLKEINNALNLLADSEIDTCAHLIFGLPKEKDNCEKIAADHINNSSIKFLKLHHLQIVKGSVYAQMYEHNEINIKLHTMQSYLETVCNFLTELKRIVYIDRFINRVPTNMLIAPKWGNINESNFRKQVENKLRSVCEN